MYTSISSSKIQILKILFRTHGQPRYHPKKVGFGLTTTDKMSRKSSVVSSPLSFQFQVNEFQIRVFCSQFQLIWCRTEQAHKAYSRELCMKLEGR